MYVLLRELNNSEYVMSCVCGLVDWRLFSHASGWPRGRRGPAHTAAQCLRAPSQLTIIVIRDLLALILRLMVASLPQLYSACAAGGRRLTASLSTALPVPVPVAPDGSRR